jgi:hypothetical protein
MELDQKAKKQKYPNVPDHCMAKSKFTDATANGLTKAILSWLELNGHKAWRQSSEGRYRPGKQFTDVVGHVRQMKGKYIPGTNKGHGDVASIVDGRFVAWEVKMKDKQSEAQNQFQVEVEKSGGKYFIIHSFDEFMKFYKELTGKH